MSKSLGNFFTLRDLVQRGFSGREIRFLLVSGHYRETFNFPIDGLSAARRSLGRIDECLSRLRELAGNTTSPAPDSATIEKFSAALNDDLNVAAGWGVVFEWVSETNRALAANEVSPPNRRRLRRYRLCSKPAKPLEKAAILSVQTSSAMNCAPRGGQSRILPKEYD